MIGAGQQFRRGETVAHRAEALEPGLACVVEPAWLDRRRRRHEQRAQPDAIARLEGRLCAACADPDAGGSRVRLDSLDAQLAEQQALAADPIFHEQDRGLEVVRGAPIQHRRVDQVRAQGRDREAEQNDDEAEQAWRAALECVGGQSPPRPGQQQCGQQQSSRTQPKRRLERQREICCDAGTEPDRQPQ